MIMLNVSQRLARANQEKISEKTLYCTITRYLECDLEGEIDAQELECVERTCEKFRVLTYRT